jgi:hypothetical protein
MRDRETDSWWSIMSSKAIGGSLNGADLVELPVGEKITWGDWKKRHPDTSVLTVDGGEHESANPYRDYSASEETFRNLQIEDRRLAPKAPIYSFWWQGKPYAAPHASFEGGRIFYLEGFQAKRLLLYRRQGASMFESSQALTVDAQAVSETTEPQALLDRIESGEVPGERLPGFDTFWYNWISVNEESLLLR